MSPSTAGYDEYYNDLEDAFGVEPDSLLVEQRHRLDPHLPVLDVGAGQGRHSLLLARAGFVVEALDPSAVAMWTLEARAAKEGLTVRVSVAGFDTFEPHAAPFGAVLVFGLFPDLRREGITSLVHHIDRLTDSGSLVFVTAFTTDDASYASYATGEEVGKHSFDHPDLGLRTFLEPGELPRIFAAYEVKYHVEEVGPEHRHGDGPVERHARAAAVFCRRAEGLR